VSAGAAPTPSAVTVIEPATGTSSPDWRELWDHRELIYVFARRDIAVRYKQSFIGVLWAVLQPLLLAGVFSLFLGLLAHIDSGSDVPYPVFAVLGMVTWLFFSSSMQKIANSTLVNAPLMTKVYFPRVAVPIAAMLSPSIDFAAGMVVALAVTLAYGVVPPIQVVLVPLILPLTLAVVLGLGLWLSAANVKYRDIGNVVSFLLLVGLFITPIVYPFSHIPEAYHPLYGLNPMVGVLELMRWMTLPGAEFPEMLLMVTLVESAVLIVTGAMYFTRAQRNFADVV